MKILIDSSENNGGNTMRWRTGKVLFSKGGLERPPFPKVTFGQRCERREITLTSSAYLIKS